MQQRLAIFVLFPVALLLIGMGFVGFIYARNSLISQWREAAILKLQRAAHSVDMRLSRTKEWIQALDIAGENRNPDIIYGWIVNQLKNIEGVSRVNLTWIGGIPTPLVEWGKWAGGLTKPEIATA
jgi:hypothetical protein